MIWALSVVLETIWYKSLLTSLFMMSFSYMKLYLTAFYFTINIFYYIFQFTACLRFQTSGVSWVKSEMGSWTQRAGGEQRKMQASPDWSVAGLISKGTCLVRRLVQGDHKKSWSQHPPARTLKVCTEVLTQPTHTIQMIPTTCYYLKTVPLGRAPCSKRTASKSHRGGDGELTIAQIQLGGQPVSYPFNDPL